MRSLRTGSAIIGALALAVGLAGFFLPLKLLWQVRLLGALLGGAALCGAASRDFWRYPAVLVGGLLCMLASDAWPETTQLVAPVFAWSLPALLALAFLMPPGHALMTAGVLFGVAGFWTATSPGVGWGLAALVAGMGVFVPYGRGAARALALSALLLGCAWTFAVARTTVAAAPWGLSTGLGLALLVLHLARAWLAPEPRAPQGTLTGAALLLSVLALGAWGPLAGFADRASRRTLSPDDTLGWRWVTRQAVRQGTSEPDVGVP